MLQVLQNLETGDTELVKVPVPSIKKGYALITTKKSLVSAGTERMLVDFGKANLFKKALSQPDRVKDVIQKAKTDGVTSTIEAVRSKLDQPLPLGYCNVGIISDPGDTGFKEGERVVSNGYHAEVVRVPKNLIAKIPNEVSDYTASFTVMGAISMQGIRLMKPTIGETIVVTGLGLIGLLSVQILLANGCKVIGIDYDSDKCKLAKEYGADIVDLSKNEDPISQVDAFSKGMGVDGVLITASSSSNKIISEAATMCRKRGRIILVGVIGLDLKRSDFYEKELKFQVSCSYGPGRYDSNYEDMGNDYPLPFVRWTEQRNFESVLSLMAKGLINVDSLISHNFDFCDAKLAYKQLDDPSSLGILLNYSSYDDPKILDTTVNINTPNKPIKANSSVGFIGAGNYASRILMPAFKKAKANFTTIVTSGGINSVHQGKKNNFLNASTEIKEVLKDSSDSIVIATQHNLHANQTIASLEAGKNVFVEKPLALLNNEIDAIEDAQKKANKIIMVGYNRRFSSHIQKAKKLLQHKKMPKCFIMTMNAGHIPKDHWTQDLKIGGGRIVGEACHYIDLMRYLSDAKISSFSTMKIKNNDYMETTEDKAIINICFDDGSIGTINYLSNGGKSFPKERIEIFCDNAVLQINNFRNLIGYGWNGFSSHKTWAQDKGQNQCVQAFMDAVEGGGNPPIPHDEIFEVARTSIAIADQLRT